MLFRDYSCFFRKNINVCSSILTLNSKNLKSKRHVSIDSIIQTQSGIFKAISESTPVSYAQDFFINVHSLTGLPWWASIVLTTVLLRTFITLPLAIYQQYILAKVQFLTIEMGSIVDELKKETTLAMGKFNWTEQYARSVYNRSVSKNNIYF